MSKLLLAICWCCASVLCNLATPSYAVAQTPQEVCTREPGIVFGYFNGVRTIRSDAETNLQRLRRAYGSTYPATGELIEYKLFYNQATGFGDFVETFEQRLKEQNSLLGGRFELFLEVLRGDGPWWRQIIATFPIFESILTALRDKAQSEFVAALTILWASPPTAVDSAAHRAQIDSLLSQRKKLVFFAHSQGNLFANAAVDYARAKTIPEAVEIVHVAPASPTLRSQQHTLADLDIVINGLRQFGTVPVITNSIPGYAQRPPGLDGETDILAHSLISIYTNPALQISESVARTVNGAFLRVKAAPCTIRYKLFATMIRTCTGRCGSLLGTTITYNSSEHSFTPVASDLNLGFPVTTKWQYSWRWTESLSERSRKIIGLGIIELPSRVNFCTDEGLGGNEVVDCALPPSFYLHPTDGPRSVRRRIQLSLTGAGEQGTETVEAAFTRSGYSDTWVNTIRSVVVP